MVCIHDNKKPSLPVEAQTPGARLEDPSRSSQPRMPSSTGLSSASTLPCLQKRHMLASPARPVSSLPDLHNLCAPAKPTHQFLPEPAFAHVLLMPLPGLRTFFLTLSCAISDPSVLHGPGPIPPQSLLEPCSQPLRLSTPAHCRPPLQPPSLSLCAASLCMQACLPGRSKHVRFIRGVLPAPSTPSCGLKQ